MSGHSDFNQTSCSKMSGHSDLKPDYLIYNLIGQFSPRILFSVKVVLVFGIASYKYDLFYHLRLKARPKESPIHMSKEK